MFPQTRAVVQVRSRDIQAVQKLAHQHGRRTHGRAGRAPRVNFSAATPKVALRCISPRSRRTRAGTTSSASSCLSSSQVATWALADDDGATALHLAAAHGAERTVTILANEMRTHGYDIEVADHDGQTALQLGARHGSLAVLMALLAAGASVHRVDFDGSTALAHASACGHLDIVEALLAADADPAASDLHSVSPLKLAVAHGHLHVASLLVYAQESADRCHWCAHVRGLRPSHALTAMSLNLSVISTTDTAAASMWPAVAVSMTRLVVLDLSRNSLVDVGQGKEGSTITSVGEGCRG